MPGDFSVAGLLAEEEFSASLEWLSGLTNLNTIVLQGTGLTDEVLEMLGSPAGLETLDVRYNNLEVVPQSIADIGQLKSLFVYGNSALTDSPRVGLANLAGTLIDADLAPDHPERATTIADLAAATYNLPIEMYEFVVNTIEFQPYAGAMKGPLATLQTKAGNDWDTASLLVDLFVDGGILEETLDPRTQNFQYVTGRVYLTIETAMEYFGAAQPDAVEQIVSNAGLDPEVIENTESQPVAIVFDHTWIEARLPMGGENWVVLDPSWKFQRHRDQARNMLDDVPWDLDIATSEYFAEVRDELPSEFYEAMVREYLAENEPATSIADIAYAGPIILQNIDSLTSALPYALWDGSETWDPESSSPRPVESFAAIPDSMTHRVQITLSPFSFTGETHFDSGLLELPQISLLPLTIRPTLTTNNLIRPELLLNGQTVVQSDTDLTPDANIIIDISYFQPGDEASPSRTVSYDSDSVYVAGNYYAIMLDARQVSQQVLKHPRRQVVEASINYMDTAVLDIDANIGGFLHLANLEYLNQLDTAAEAIYGITAAKRYVSEVGIGLVTAAGGDGGFYQPGTSTPFNLLSLSPALQQQLLMPVLPERYIFDLKSIVFGSAPIDGNMEHQFELRRLLSHTYSALEHAVWEGLTNADSMSTIKSLQLANQGSGEFNHRN